MNAFNRYLAPILASVALCGVSFGATEEAPYCNDEVDFVEQEGVTFGLANIIGDDKALLIRSNVRCDEKKGACPVCPRDETACKSKSFVLPGDLVITGRSFKGYRCILYRDQKNQAGSAGYVLESRLQGQPAASVTQKDWLGEWREWDDLITLRAEGDKLSAEGQATWPSGPGKFPWKDVPEGPHTGGMSGVAEPKGNQVTFVDAEMIGCRVDLTLLPPFLLARDNGECGGMNVRFAGAFMREGDKKTR